MELKVRGVPVGPGTVMEIKGERGKFTFAYPTWSKAGRLSLTFHSPDGSFRSFYPERVRKVYT
jgi:hypothetical protein